MATRISDARDRRRAVSRIAEAAPYAGRGAGLYSEVSLSPVLRTPVRAEAPPVDDDRLGPRA
jgi:hypothetical protein